MRQSGNASIYILPPKKSPQSRSIYILQGNRLVFKLADGYASFKPHRTELRPFGTKVEKVETGGVFPLIKRSIEQWIPGDSDDWSSTAFKADQGAAPEPTFRPVKWVTKMEIPYYLKYKALCLDITSSTEKLKKEAESPLIKRFPRIRNLKWVNLDRYLFRRHGGRNWPPKPSSPLPYQYFPLKGAKVASVMNLRLYNAYITLGARTFDKSNSQKGSFMTIRVNSSGAFYRIEASSPMGNFSIDGGMGSLGGAVKFNPAEPFSIAQKAGFLSIVSTSAVINGTTLPIMDSVMQLSTSEKWTKFWKESLRSPPAGIPAAFAECKAAAKNKNYKSLACEDSWKMLNTFDTLKINVTEFNTSYSREAMTAKLAQVFPFYVFNFGDSFSRLAIFPNKNKGWILRGQLRGNDWKRLKRRKKFIESLQKATPCLMKNLRESRNVKEVVLLFLASGYTGNSGCK